MRVFNRHAASVAGVPAQDWGTATELDVKRYPWALHAGPRETVPMTVSAPEAPPVPVPAIPALPDVQAPPKRRIVAARAE